MLGMRLEDLGRPNNRRSTYIRGPIAHGTVAVSDGATENGDGTFRFPVSGGSFDPATGSGTVTMSGRVHFEGHDYGAGPLLMMTVEDPRVVIAGTGGTLHANVTSKSLSDGQLVSYPDVALATLDLTPTPAPTDPVIAAVPPKAREYSASGAIAFVEHFFDRVNEAVTGPDTGLIPALSEPGCDACAGLQGMAVELKEQDLRAAAPMFSVRDPQFVAKRDETIMTIRFTLESHAVDILKADGSVASTRSAGSGGRVVAVQWRGDSWRILGAESTDD